jgi:hypothetical protein
VHADIPSHLVRGVPRSTLYAPRRGMIPCRLMVTFSTLFVWVTAPATFFLEFAFLFFAYRRKLYRQLLFLPVYVVSATASEVCGWAITYSSWYRSTAWLYFYWSVQFALSILRLLTIAEISLRTLRAYPAVWTFTSRLLTAAAATLMFWTIHSSIQNRQHFRVFILSGSLRFEFMQAVLLLLFLLLVTYYRVPLSPLYRLVLIGAGVYSSIQVAANQFGIIRGAPPNSVTDYIRRGTYMIPIAVWTYAAWRWGATSQTPPELIAQSTYDDLSPQIHDRLRELNDKLAKLSRRPPR